MRLIGRIRAARQADVALWYTKGTERDYRTVSLIVWRIGGKHSEWTHTIPIGTEFESSVPWWLRWVLSPDHPYFLFPAVVHDTLIEAGYTRPMCDGEWLSAARFTRAPVWLRETGYMAIRFKQYYRGLTNGDIKRSGYAG